MEYGLHMQDLAGLLPLCQNHFPSLGRVQGYETLILYRLCASGRRFTLCVTFEARHLSLAITITMNRHNI